MENLTLFQERPAVTLVPFIIRTYVRSAEPTSEETSVFHGSFTTAPQLRIRRGHNIGIRRCYQIMQFLKQTGHQDDDLVDREDIENAIFHCVGTDQRTINRYMGRDVWTRGYTKQGASLEPPRYIKHIKGYLERLRLIEREPNSKGKFRISFSGVNEFLEEESGTSITNLCVYPQAPSFHNVGGVGGTGPFPHDDQKNTTTTTHNTHTNQLSESIPEDKREGKNSL